MIYLKSALSGASVVALYIFAVFEGTWFLTTKPHLHGGQSPVFGIGLATLPFWLGAISLFAVGYYLTFKWLSKR